MSQQIQCSAPSDVGCRTSDIQCLVLNPPKLSTALRESLPHLQQQFGYPAEGSLVVLEVLGDPDLATGTARLARLTERCLLLELPDSMCLGHQPEQGAIPSKLHGQATD